MTDDAMPLPATFESDQLVVDRPYADAVIARLTELHIDIGARHDEPDLDLVLLSDLREQALPGVTVARPADADAVLGELRRQFASRCGGWVPAMGKNRFTSPVVGYPQPQSMFLVDPQPLATLAASMAPPGAGHGVRVGVLDSRLYPHPRIDGHYDIADDELLRLEPGRPTPARAGHATFVADLILTAAPAAHLTMSAALGDDGKGTLWDTITRMVKVVRSGVDVLNLSLGCRTSDGLPPLALARAVERLSRDTLIVAAAGNHGELFHMVKGYTRGSPTWPAALPGVVAVGAHDGAGNAVSFSPELPWVDCLAPGLNVTGAYLDGPVEMFADPPVPFNGFAIWSGTSFAAAAVTGAVAARVVPGTISAADAVRQLIEDADPLVTKYVWPA